MELARNPVLTERDDARHELLQVKAEKSALERERPVCSAAVATDTEIKNLMATTTAHVEEALEMLRARDTEIIKLNAVISDSNGRSSLGGRLSQAQDRDVRVNQRSCMNAARS